MRDDRLRFPGREKAIRNIGKYSSYGKQAFGQDELVRVFLSSIQCFKGTIRNPVLPE